MVPKSTSLDSDLNPDLKQTVPAPDPAVSASAVVAEEKPADKIKRLEKSIADLEAKTPEEKRTPEDWSNLAEAQHKLLMCYQWENHTEIREGFEKISRSLEKIPTETRTFHNWKELANAQFQLATRYSGSSGNPPNLTKAVEWYGKAGSSYHTMKEMCRKPREKQRFYEALVKERIAYSSGASFLASLIPVEKRTEEDWRKLAIYQEKVGNLYFQDDTEWPQVERWQKEACTSRGMLPEGKYTAKDWLHLMEQQSRVGLACAKQNNWVQAVEW